MNQQDEQQTTVPPEDLYTLEGYLDRFVKMKKYEGDRGDHIEMLMGRNSAKKWNAKKKQKMVRRLINARQAVTELEPIIDQVNVRIEQISTPVDQ